MTERKRHLVSAFLLIAISVVWITLVWRTIPAGMGGGDIGPRAFPMFLGILLGLFSLGMAAEALRPTAQPEEIKAEDEPDEGGKLFPAVLTFAHILAYGFLMQKLGFILSTMLVVASVMIICVGDRNPLRIIAMSLGVTLGTWLVFGKILGVYLAVGTWINIG